MPVSINDGSGNALALGMVYERAGVSLAVTGGGSVAVSPIKPFPVYRVALKPSATMTAIGAAVAAKSREIAVSATAATQFAAAAIKSREIRVAANASLSTIGVQVEPRSAQASSLAELQPVGSRVLARSFAMTSNAVTNFNFFAPIDVFANGEDGAFLEAPTLDTLYTDDAGTTQAASGDPVAVWSDSSGNGKNATQTELANRMVVSGTGPYYLDPDGINDNFSIPLGAGFTGDFCLILDTGPLFGSIDTGASATWNYTVNAAYIPDGNVHALIVVDRAFTSAEKQGLVDHYAGAVTSVPSTAKRAFRDRTDLTALDASYGDWTQVTDAARAFLGCSALTTPPDVSGWTQVTDAAYAFYNCSALTTPPDVSGWTQVTDAGGMFSGCSALTTPPDVSGWTQVTNARTAFYNCSALTTPPDVSGWTQVMNAAYAFYDCSSLGSAVNLENWNPTILTDGSKMMSGISAAGFDQTAYDSALTAWDATYDLTTVNTLPINFGSAQYGSGAPKTARDTLAANGWTITDGGESS